MSKRVQITMSEDLLSRVEKYAKFTGIPRATAICVLCSQALAQTRTVDVLGDVVEAYKETQKRMGDGTDAPQR